VGIRGSRNVEIVGNVSRDTTVLSPARTDLADGTRVHAENVIVPAKQATDARADDPPPDPVASPVLDRNSATVASPALDRNAAAVVTSAADSDDAAISSALAAHVDSIVNDARRNVAKYPAR
jgi:hypothetical protein